MEPKSPHMSAHFGLGRVTAAGFINGIADLSDPMLKDRIAELKAIRDQARTDAERAEDAIERIGPSITPRALKTFARQARRRMRTESGGPKRFELLTARFVGC